MNGNSKKYFGKIIARAFELIRIVGSNFIPLTPSQISRETDGIRYFNFGPVNGDYNTDYNNSLFTFDFQSTDVFGNFFDLGNDVTSFITSNTIKINKNGNPIAFNFMKSTNTFYSLSFSIKEPGDYKIESSKFPDSKPYIVRVISATIFLSYSYCQITNDLSKGVIDNAVVVTLVCNLFDKFMNPIDISVLDRYGAMSRNCYVDKSSDGVNFSRALEIPSTTIIKQNAYTCSFSSFGNGSYRVNSSFKMGNTSFEFNTSYVTIPSRLNEFKVITTPLNMNRAKFYDFTLNKFSSFSTEDKNIVTFTTNDDVPLTLISLADDSGEESANIGYGPNFNIADFSGTFSNSHNTSYTSQNPVKFDFYTLPANGKKYISVSFINQKTFILRNSFYYVIYLKYKNSTVNIRLNYPMINSYGQTVCLHNLDINKTTFIKKDSNDSFMNNENVQIGQILLKTTDNFLYNKFIDATRIKYTLTPNNVSTKIKILEDAQVAGFYNIFVQGTISAQYSLDLLVDSYTFLTKYIFKIMPQLEIASMISSNNNKFISQEIVVDKGQTLVNVSADDTPSIFFTAQDFYKNELAEIPTQVNSFLGLGVDISVSLNSNTDKFDFNSVKFTYNSNLKNYQIYDNIKKPGNYIIIFYCKYESRIIFNYYKKPGLSSNVNSFALFNSANSIKLSQQITVSLNLRDNFNNLISSDASLLTDELKKIKVYALHEDNTTKVYLSLNPNSGLIPIFSGNIIEKAGKYSIKVDYTSSDSKVLSINCNNCVFDASYEQFDINNCKLYMVTSKNIIMTKDTITNINNVNDIPLFNFLFFDAGGNQLNYVDNKSYIKAYITGANNFRLDLNTEWIKSYQILWTMPDDNVSEDKKFKNLKGDNYLLKIDFNDVNAHQYTLKLLGDGNDSDAGNGQPDYSKTYLYETNINALAGVTYSTNIEFRTSENLRVNYYEDLSNFTFKNSANLAKEKFNIIPQKGPKKGTYILAIYSEVAFLPSNPLILTILFKNSEIPTKIRISVKPNELSFIEILDESIKSKSDLSLKDSNVENEALIYFQAYDRFKNVFLDIYDINIYSVSRIKSLFNIQHLKKFEIILNAGTSFQKDKFFVGITSRHRGEVSLASTFLGTNIWKVNFTPFAFDPAISFGEVTPTTLKSGEKISFNIYLRDKYNNEIDVIYSEDVFNATELYFRINGGAENKGAKSIDITKNTFSYNFQLFKKGTYAFNPRFGQSNIKCDNCQAIVYNSDYVLNKSALLYISGTTTTTTTKVTDKFELSKTNLPTFGMNLYDTNENIYDKIPDDFSLTALLIQKDGQTALELCTEKNNNFLNIFICRDLKSRKNWQFLLNGVYTLKLEDKSPKANPTDKLLSYSIYVIDGAVDPNASNGEIDISKTVFGVSELNTVAGEVSSFTIEIRTIDNKRKYAWEDEPEKYITLSFSQIIDKNYITSVTLGEMPGIYIVKVSSNKAFTSLENNYISFKINGVDLFNKVKLITKPNIPSYAEFINIQNQKLTDLPEGNADDIYELRIRIYDKYTNLINPKLSDVNMNILPPEDKSSFSIISKLNVNLDSSVQIYISPIFAGKYTLKSTLFKDIAFNVIPGLPTSNNSLAIVNKEIVAGGIVKMIVIPFDKNNNLCNAENIRTKEKFSAYFKYKINSDYVSYLDMGSFTIDNYEFPEGSKFIVKAYIFEAQLKFKGQNFFKVIFTNNEIKCVNCITNVLPSNALFDTFYISYFDPVKGSFADLIDNTAFDNIKTEPIIRLYPRDQYFNFINTITEFSSYSLSFIDKKNAQTIYKFKTFNIDDGKQEYIQFSQNDDFAVNKDLTFSTLTKGEYILIINYNTDKKKTVNTFLLGRDSDQDASNEELDISKTVITDSVLEFESGLTGRLIIELRTISNLRKNNWFYKVDVEPRINDQSFTKKINNATKLGQYLVTFGSTLANTFPTYTQYGLKITINGQEVTQLNPLIKVNPGIMAKSFIVDSFLKKETLNTNKMQILDGNCDKSLQFSIQAKDQYDNITKVNTELLKLSITGPDGNLVTYTSDSQYSASLGFNADSRISGNYILIGNTLPSYYYYSAPGALNFDNTIVMNNISTISAGKKASVIITPKDKNNNIIDPAKVSSDISVTCKSSKTNTNIASEISIEGKKMTYSATLTEKGNNLWTILITQKLKPCSSCKVEVTPDIASSEKSLTYLFDEVNNSQIKYINDAEINISNKSPINVYVTLRDKYENIIDEIPSNVYATNANFSGLDIDPIKLEVLKTNPYKQIFMRIPQPQYTIFNHLISGKNYAFKYTISDGNNSSDFNFPINILSDRNDSGYGNGKYVVKNTYLSHNELNLYADKTSTFIMHLKTAKNLFYNDDIDIDNDIKYKISPDDNTFKFKVERDYSKYNYYTISVFSRKSIVDSKLSLTISLRNPEDNSKFEYIPQTVNLVIKPKMPPSPLQTKFDSKLIPATLEPKKSVSLSFNLADEFGNVYNKNNDVLNYLVFMNNDLEVKDTVITLKNDGLTYEAIFTPPYPPKSASFYINYFDKENKILLNILNEVVERKIVSSPDFKYTRIVGENINIMKAGDILNLSIVFYDSFNICVDFDTDIPVIANIKGPLNSDLSFQKSYTYTFKKMILDKQECKTSYVIEVPQTAVYSRAGEYEISIFVGSQQYKLEPIIQKVIPADLDVSKILSKYVDEDFLSNQFKAGSKISFYIVGYDKFFNVINTPLTKFSAKLKNKLNDTINPEVDFSLFLNDETVGQLNGHLSVQKSGSYKLEYYYEDQLVSINSIKGPSDFIVVPSICNKKYLDMNNKQIDKAIAGEPTNLAINCRDVYNNKISVGGEIFSAKILVKIDNGKTSEVNNKITDNLDGSYKLEFTPPLKGKYDIKILLNNDEYYTLLNKEITDSSCPAETPIRCTNNPDKCVREPKDCLNDKPTGETDCKLEPSKPYGCLVQAKPNCVESMTYCDCPQNYVKCQSTNVCIKKERFESLCFDPFVIDCQVKFPTTYPIFSNDGICRSSNESPNQRVCPLGFALCPDLSCRSSIEKCEDYEDCKSDEFRCSDLSCVKDQKDCPNTIICPYKNQFVCPDGTCVDNEFKCKGLPSCNSPLAYLCSQNVCSNSKNNCPKSISCGHGKSLCSDMICRTRCRQDII